MFNNFKYLLVFSLNMSMAFGAPQQAPLKQVTEMPNDIPVCKEKDQNINECIRNAFQQMLPRAKNGIPEINIPPLDPLEVERTGYEFRSNVVDGKLALRNVKIRGLTDTTFNSVDFQRKGDSIKFRTKSRTPKLLIDGKYKAEVKINNVTINSRGLFNLTMTNIDVVALHDSEVYERDGHTYVRVNKFSIDPTLGNFKFYATGLVPDAILNEALLEFINQNWRNVYKNLIAETRSTWEPEVIKVANEFLSHLPFDFLIVKD